MTVKAISEVVKIIDVEPFEAGEGDLYRFRLEISRGLDSGLFSGTVYRLETYRLQPTFPQDGGQLPDWQDDALVHVMDQNYESLTGDSVEEVLQKFQRILADRFE